MEILPAILEDNFEDGLRGLKQAESFVIIVRRMIRNSSISF
jgi:hypothetical protein